MQLSVAAPFILHGFVRAYGEQSASTFRLGDGEAVRRLLYLNVDLLRDLVTEEIETMPSYKIGSRHNYSDGNCARGKPAAQSGYVGSHLASVYMTEGWQRAGRNSRARSAEIAQAALRTPR